MEVTIKERIKFLANKKYCYGCFQPMASSHNAKTCTRRLTCSSWKGNHPTHLHEYIPKVMKDKSDGSQDNGDSGNIKSNYATLDNDVKCATAKSGSTVISMCIVPVKIKHGDNNKMVTVYAMLDNCSQGSFTLSTVVKKLGIQGIKTTFKLKTLHGERSESTFAIEGVKVTGIHGDSSWLALPKQYSRREIQVDKEEIATLTNIREWEYLQPISNEIVNNDDVHVGLLIGENCMKALEPTRILQSQDGGPYAYKTILGWCVVGSINCTTKDCSTSCNRVAVKDVASSKLGPNHFNVQESVKDISLEEMFQRMYKQDFSELETVVSDSILKNLSEISCDDRKFLDIVERGTVKRNGYYVVTLPFRDQEWLCQTISNKQLKDYARRCNETPTGKTWYIPYHAVYHPSKPGKIRFVFDCSAEFEGKSINKELLPGLDLTNQIVGILIRFRDEKVAVMADVESMCYQVQAPENQRTNLKFLWW